MPDTNPDAVKERESGFHAKHAKSIREEIGSLRKWLEYLEQDIDSGVIPAIVLMSISKSCSKLIYSAGMINGAELSESDRP